MARVDEEEEEEAVEVQPKAENEVKEDKRDMPEARR